MFSGASWGMKCPRKRQKTLGSHRGCPEKFLDPLAFLAMTADLSAGRHVLHVDMDAFFAMVAIRDRPDLADQPVIVGGGDIKGWRSSATYPARRFGVHSGMPMTRARRTCPQAVVLSPDYTDFVLGIGL